LHHASTIHSTKSYVLLASHTVLMALDDMLPSRFLLQMAEYCINAKVTGVLRHTQYLEQWAQHPDVLFTSYLLPVSRHGCMRSSVRVTSGMFAAHGSSQCSAL
jgi:hypothetical protein